jgi:hypothetical protein
LNILRHLPDTPTEGGKDVSPSPSGHIGAPIRSYPAFRQIRLVRSATACGEPCCRRDRECVSGRVSLTSNGSAGNCLVRKNKRKNTARAVRG